MSYTWEGMEKISYQEALERMNNEQEVYLLYDDQTEGLADDFERMSHHHECGGEFGVEQ
jgi:hypothetical protein